MTGHRILLLGMLLGISILSSVSFYESFAVEDYQDIQSKKTITISYANDTSETRAILVNANQKFTVSQQYSWTNENFTRFNLPGYHIDNGPFVSIQRSSSGNFTLDIFADSNHSIVFLVKPQFEIITSEISKMNFSPPSPTNDNWFDAGSDVQIIAPYVLQSDQDTRQQLTGWSMDSPDINVISRQESGTFKSDIIHMSSSHRIDLEYTTQYYVKVISNFGRALGTDWYDSGTIVDVSTIPSDDILVKHVFAGWQGQVIGSANQESVQVFVDSPKTIVSIWLADYTNVSIIGIFAISVIVLAIIYQKRRTTSKDAAK
ncbi:MAG: hypothetical protein WA833_03700 [Nitrosotalea sp.]